jgi:hypothetical protein
VTTLRSSIATDLITALADGLQSELGTDVLVTVGLPVGMNSGDYLGIGIVDPEDAKSRSSFNSTITWATDMTVDGFDEVGELSLAAVAIRGSDDLSEPIAAVNSILSDLIAWLRSKWSTSDLLGIEGLWDLRVSNLDLTTYQNESGCAAYLQIRLAFQATI